MFTKQILRKVVNIGKTVIAQENKSDTKYINGKLITNKLTRSMVFKFWNTSKATDYPLSVKIFVYNTIDDAVTDYRHFRLQDLSKALGNFHRDSQLRLYLVDGGFCLDNGFKAITVPDTCAVRADAHPATELPPLDFQLKMTIPTAKQIIPLLADYCSRDHTRSPVCHAICRLIANEPGGSILVCRATEGHAFVQVIRPVEVHIKTKDLPDTLDMFIPREILDGYTEAFTVTRETSKLFINYTEIDKHNYLIATHLSSVPVSMDVMFSVKINRECLGVKAQTADNYFTPTSDYYKYTVDRKSYQRALDMVLDGERKKSQDTRIEHMFSYFVKLKALHSENVVNVDMLNRPEDLNRGAVSAFYQYRFIRNYIKRFPGKRSVVLHVHNDYTPLFITFPEQYNDDMLVAMPVMV